jgi:hypothetical protein
VSVLLLLALVAGAPERTPATTQKTWLIAIGVSDYQHVTKLRYASRDAERIQQVMRANKVPDNQVLLLRDADLVTTRKKVEQFLAPRAGTDQKGKPVPLSIDKEDTLIFFFAGHGLKTDKGLVLLPRDAELARLAETALTDSMLAKWLKDCPARHKIVLLDACHSGAIPGAIGASQLDGRTVLDRFGHLEGSFTIASCQGEEKSLEYKEGEAGLFTHWLALGLQGKADLNGDKEISVDELFAYVNRNMTDPNQPLGGTQTPIRRFEGGSAIVTVLGGRNFGGIWQLTPRPRGIEHHVLVVETITGTRFRGEVFRGFVGGPGISSTKVSGEFINNEFRFEGGKLTLDPETQELTGRTNVLAGTLKPVERRPKSLQVGAVAKGNCKGPAEAIRPQTAWSLRVTACQQRKLGGNLHVFDFQAQVGFHYMTGGRDKVFNGVLVGESVFLVAADGTERFVGTLAENGAFHGHWREAYRPVFAQFPAPAEATARTVPRAVAPTPRPAAEGSSPQTTVAPPPVIPGRRILFPGIRRR